MQYGSTGAGSANPACVLLNNITMTTPPLVEEPGATICLKTGMECTNSTSLAPAEDAFISEITCHESRDVYDEDPPISAVPIDVQAVFETYLNW
jgi:hypothetical protein